MNFLRRMHAEDLPLEETAAEDGAVGSALDPAHRERIDSELSARGIGDDLERRMFLAALDYQIAAFATELPLAGVGEQLTKQVCHAAAVGLNETAGDQAQRICRTFVAEVARSYDACFETPPSAELGSPFHSILRTLRESTGLVLRCDGQLIDQAIGTAGPGAR